MIFILKKKEEFKKGSAKTGEVQSRKAGNATLQRGGGRVFERPRELSKKNHVLRRL